ncbi:MAG: hypothetical protein Q8M83_05645 [bacterium]|nr:hypothetical protein [bacterium]
MKKFIIPILVATIVVLGAYIVFDKYQSSKNDAQNNNQVISQIASNTEEQSGDLFTKKKECAGYKDDIMEDILTPNLLYDESDPILEEIFYSPKRNSCLYTFRYYKSPNCLKVDIDTYVKMLCGAKERQIVDFLTKETVYSSVTYNNCFERLLNKKDADITICKTVSEKVDELKN